MVLGEGVPCCFTAGEGVPPVGAGRQCALLLLRFVWISASLWGRVCCLLAAAAAGATLRTRPTHPPLPTYLPPAGPLDEQLAPETTPNPMIHRLYYELCRKWVAGWVGGRAGVGTVTVSWTGMPCGICPPQPAGLLFSCIGCVAPGWCGTRLLQARAPALLGRFRCLMCCMPALPCTLLPMRPAGRCMAARRR